LKNSFIEDLETSELALQKCSFFSSLNGINNTQKKEEQEDPLLKESTNRYVMFPIEDDMIWVREQTTRTDYAKIYEENN
jgi:hypothetical protein